MPLFSLWRQFLRWICPLADRQDLTCSWDGFSAAVRQAIDPAWVSTLP
ncbi:MAG: hypothetical protein ABSC62_07620 [Terracidiphilus sp.]